MKLYTGAENKSFWEFCKEGQIEFLPSFVTDWHAHPRYGPESKRVAKDIDPIFHHTKNLWKYTDVRVESSLVKTWHINPGAPSKEMKDFDYFLEVIDMPAVYQASTGNQHMLLVFRVSDCTVACLGIGD